MDSNRSSNEGEINPNLQTDKITLGHLKITLYMRFGSYARAGVEAGLSASRTKQILNGHFLPKSPELIKKIATAWNIDPVILTLLFDRYREKLK